MFEGNIKGETFLKANFFKICFEESISSKQFQNVFGFEGSERAQIIARPDRATQIGKFMNGSGEEVEDIELRPCVEVSDDAPRARRLLDSGLEVR